MIPHMNPMRLLLFLVLTIVATPSFAQVAPVESVPLAPIEVKPVPEARPADSSMPNEPSTPAPSAPSAPVSLARPSQSDPQTTPYRPAFVAPQPPQGRNVGGSVPDAASNQGAVFCTLKVALKAPATPLGTEVKTYLDTNTDKANYQTFNHTQSGGYDYCVNVLAHSDNARVYTALKRLLADHPESYAALSGEGFATVTTR